MRSLALLLPLLLAVGDGRLLPVPVDDASPVRRSDVRTSLRQTQFVPNLGQWGDSVRYGVFGETLGWLHDDGYSLRLERSRGDGEDDLETARHERIGCVVRTRFLDAQVPEFVAGEGLATRRHFLVGPPDRWRRDVVSCERVTMRGVLPGIDVVFRPLAPGRRGLCEYDLVVAAGADPRAFVARCEGVEALRIDAQGRLCTRLSDGESTHELVQEAPIAWQETPAGRRPLRVVFRLLDSHTYSFDAPELDPRFAAVVDPGIVWGTYLGGGQTDRINAMSWREGVGVWVAGWAGSTDFPTTLGAYRTVGGQDAFVARLTDTGSALVFATYLGGARNDEVRGLALGPGDTPVVVGVTQSTNFPTTAGVLQPTFRGTSGFLDIGDGFVTHLNASGSGLVSSTYLGGFFDDIAEAVHCDQSGNLTVAGWTSSADFPVSAGAPQASLAGLLGATSDGFIARLTPNCQTLLSGTYAGGSLNEHFVSVDRDPATGDVVAAGWTASSDYPTTLNAFRASPQGAVDGIVTRVNAAGTAFVFSTYLGAAEFDYSYAVRFGANGTVWVGGTTDSSTWPVTLNAPQITPGGEKDGTVTQLSANGQSLLFSTRLGGAGPDRVRALDLATNGIAVVGEAGVGFPVTADAVQSTFGNGMFDGFLCWLTNGGSTLAFSTYLGGAEQDMLYAVDASDSGIVVAAGRSFSADFPIAPAGLQAQRFGAEDGVVVQLDLVTTFGDSLGVTGESDAAATPVGDGDHELLRARLDNLTARELVVDSVTFLVAGAGDARLRASALRVFREDVAGGAPQLVAGPMPIPVDDGQFFVALQGCVVPGSGAIRLRAVAELHADPNGAPAEVALAVVGPESWTLHATGAGAGPAVSVAAPGRASGTPLVLGAMPGDVDGDRQRTVLDVRGLLARVGMPAGAFDCDGDDVIGVVDVAATHAAVLGRSTVTTAPTTLLRSTWQSMRGVFAAGTVQVTLGGRVLKVGAATPRAITFEVPADMLTGTQEFVVSIAGRILWNALVPVQ